MFTKLCDAGNISPVLAYREQSPEQNLQSEEHLSDARRHVHLVTVQPVLHLQKMSSLQDFIASGNVIQCGTHSPSLSFNQPHSSGEGSTGFGISV